MISEAEKEVLRTMLRSMGLTEEEVEHELVGSLFVTEAMRFSDDSVELITAMYQRFVVMIGAANRVALLLTKAAKVHQDIGDQVKKDPIMLKSILALAGLADEVPQLTAAFKDILDDKGSVDESYELMKHRYEGVEQAVDHVEPTEDEKLIAEVLARHTGGGIKC
jgi:hypothetical protein